jgi:diacylglycerol kinase family enzyme
MDPHDGIIPILVNASAGGHAPVARRLEEAMGRLGLRFQLHDLPPDRLPAVARALRDADVPIIGVAGGDGTIRTVAEVLAGGESALAVLPVGSLNHFARRLGIPDLDAAAAALAGGHVACVPVGLVDEHVFLNTATFGQYAAVVRRREEMRRWLGKWPAAGVAFLRVVRRLRTFSITVDLPDGAIERTTPLLWVGVGHASFPRVRLAAAALDADQLEVVIARVASRRHAVAFLTRLFVRTLHARPSTQDRAVEVLHTRHLVLRGPTPVEATLDGEVVRVHAPLAVSLQPRALRVIAPAG